MSTIFIAGVYGVGKNTLCENVSRNTGIPFYSAGDLISKINGEKYGANKVVLDKHKNQDILAHCVSEILRENPCILLAGHCCILGKNDTVDPLPEKAFENLEISTIILLETDPETIHNHLSTRDHREYSLSLIQKLILTERQIAQRISTLLNCPLSIHQMTYSDFDIDFLTAFL